MPAASFGQRVTEAVAALDEGEVVSYGEIAVQVGSPAAARAVGNVLASSDGLPWWRVVAADGRLAPGKEERQARLLRAEGVTVTDGRVISAGSGG